MKNTDYWRSRMGQVMSSELDNADRVCADIRKVYREAAKSLQDDIRAWYSKFAKDNQISYSAAKKRLQAGELEEFRWTVEEYIRRGQENGISADWERQLKNASARVHISRLEALQIQCYQHAYEASGNLLDKLQALLHKIYANMYYRNCFEVQKGIGQGSPFAHITTSVIDKILSKPWTDDGIEFSARIWSDRAKLVSQLRTKLPQSLIRGEPPERLAQQMAKLFDTSQSNALNLIQTESAHFANQAQSDSFAELGIDEYEIIVALDDATCPICGDMDGRKFKLSDEQPGINSPVFHPRCRCCKAPVVDDLIGERIARNAKSKTYYVPANMSYKEWRRKYVD